MKTLSVQQPWASLIAAGIKDVENRTWQPKQLPGRILIHASKKCTLRSLSNEPVEWMQEIFNEQLFGNLPDFVDMPDGAIIGYATVERVDKDSANSVWAAGESDDENLYYWHLTDAHLFDEPITGVKGKLHLWDYDLDEDNLPPAHSAELTNVDLDGENVIVPLNETYWKAIKPNSSIFIDLGTLAQLLCLPDVYDLKPMKTITFTHGGRQRTFKLSPDTESRYFTDGGEEQNPAIFPSLLKPEGSERYIAYFIWSDEIL